VQAGDSAETRRLARQIASRFDPKGGQSGGALDQIANRAGSPPGELQPLVKKASRRIERRMDREAMQLGAWVEAARLAAARLDGAFFQDSAATREMLDRAAGLTAAERAGRDAVARVRVLLAPPGPPRWDALRPALDDMLSEIASL
jgi:hypothetical protein